MGNPSDPHPARLAAQRSMDASARGDRAAWLGLFADDAIVEDPVGPSYLDPEGKGQRGRAAIAAFWDKAIAHVRPLFSIQQSIVCGNECVNVGTLTLQFPDGAAAQLHGVFTYRVDDASQVIALRSFWEPEALRTYPPFAERERG
jgi:hypothetical protein